jgi:hypothetical protein
LSSLRILAGRLISRIKRASIPKALKLAFGIGCGARLGGRFHIAHVLASNKKATRRWLVGETVAAID